MRRCAMFLTVSTGVSRKATYSQHHKKGLCSVVRFTQATQTRHTSMAHQLRHHLFNLVFFDGLHQVFTFHTKVERNRSSDEHR